MPNLRHSLGNSHDESYARQSIWSPTGRSGLYLTLAEACRYVSNGTVIYCTSHTAKQLFYSKLKPHSVLIDAVHVLGAVLDRLLHPHAISMRANTFSLYGSLSGLTRNFKQEPSLQIEDSKSQITPSCTGDWGT